MTMAALASRGIQAWGSKKVTREFQDISASYVYVQQALWFAMKEYNKASKDTYVYKVTNILRSQEQISAYTHFVQCPGDFSRISKMFTLFSELSLILVRSGPQLLVTHGWRPQGNENSENRDTLKLYFPAVVEYASHMYNLKSQDRNAYKVLRVLRSWREWREEKGLVFSMELQFARTRCGKFDEDIDNCPFQATPDMNNTVTCFFTVDAEPWKTEFQLLNDTCLEGSAV
ncbi:hypothetical protein MJG53_011681 [Ovis ammon polii x Ovis aries]|uniref:Cystatin domain-containing protein n=2 Tax=Ovis TaxID=9935 RepID=A0AAD4U1K9_OVIAM|nr:hypothetical protein MG293_011545 [Ovis ammon polii]KAI4575478.1 hypothetical protein MJG53_011681 [Ovis ammon polii x Ovis aries]